jgi:hypothetical protein
MTEPTEDHEARMYGGGNPDVFLISKSELQTLLVTGQNVLAIEIHNISNTSSDLTGRTWLHFGIHTPELLYGPNPPFFNELIITNYHTNFKIAFGENVRLLDANGLTIDSLDIPDLLPGHSMMRMDDTGSWCLTDNPTPDATNGSNCLSGYASNSLSFLLLPDFIKMIKPLRLTEMMFVIPLMAANRRILLHSTQDHLW